MYQSKIINFLHSTALEKRVLSLIELLVFKASFIHEYNELNILLY